MHFGVLDGRQRPVINPKKLNQSRHSPARNWRLDGKDRPERSYFTIPTAQEERNALFPLEGQSISVQLPIRAVIGSES